MENLNELEILIFKSIQEITNRSLKISSSIITKEIKIKIGKLGYKKKYEVASSEHHGEWIYDLIWFTEKDDILLSVPLVLESEISDRTKKGLRFDFEKLLISKSENKIFICMAEGKYSDNSVSNIKELLYKSFRSFKSMFKNERVLLLIWDDYNTGNLFPFIFEK